jgi:hypothetical protein
MLNSTVLEVVIGLVFCFAAVSLIASSVYEAISSLLKLRARSLLSGVKAMLNDQAFTGFAKELYSHALISPRESGVETSATKMTAKPSYIDPKHFSVALIDVIQKGPGTFDDLGRKIEGIEDPQLKELLRGLYARADGEIENLEDALASWFDSGMARVSGSYKRHAQLFSFITAFVIAALFNIDTFHLFASLWDHPALVAQIAAPTAANASAALEGLKTLPVGWQTFPPSSALVFFGWLATACSALFGAPFWFDLLQRLVNLRGTGPKPQSDGQSGGGRDDKQVDKK